MKNYGGHSAHLLFHVIISELQCIILDSHKKYYLGAFIYWACLFILGTFICSGCIYSFWACLFVLSAYALWHPLINITHGHPWPPLDPCHSTSATITFLGTFPSTIPHVLLTVPAAPSLSVMTLTSTVHCCRSCNIDDLGGSHECAPHTA